ncbi:hypothetical protein [Streptomyces sp. NPDC021622]|uniref:hypothetical protein n=1 Tax=Streptomyces sp. NPDC021622 TaxID=3155013 RepID=UPI0033E45699
MTEQAQKRPAPDPAAVRDAVTRKAVLGALLDEIKTAHAEASTDVQHLLDQQYKATGTTKVDATLPSGMKVGSVSRIGGEIAAQVVDDEAFRVWVRDTFPSEHVVEVIPAQVVTRVQPAFVAKVLAEVNAAGTAHYADPTTAEVHEVPGVALKPHRAATHRMTYTRRSAKSPVEGRELVAQAWREGALAAHVLPALAPASVGQAGGKQ